MLTITPAREPVDAVDVWRRHPADVARLVFSLLILGLLALLGWLAPNAVSDVSADLVDVVRRLPVVVQQGLLGVAQMVALLGPVVVVAWLVIGRRLRLLVTSVAAGVVASVAMVSIQGWLDRTVPPGSREALDGESWITGAAFPSGTYIAALTAVILVLGAGASHRWRRAGWIVIVSAALFRLATAVAVPVNLSVTVAVGAAAASAVLLAAGAPTRRLSLEGLVGVLRSIGVEAGDVEEVDVGASHSRTFRTTEDPSRFVKLIGRDERAAEVLFRSVRRLRVRGLEDENPGRSAPQIARYEALGGLLAERNGVDVASVIAVGNTEEGDGVVVLSEVQGQRLVDLDTAEIDDALLAAIWAELGLLHRARIAHRWLDATHLVVREDRTVAVLDLRWATVGADDATLAVDVADLLVSLALLVGTDRAVGSAVAALPAAELEAALPLLQPLVLSPSNRAALKGAPDTLSATRESLAAALEVEEVTLAPVARLTVGRVVGWFGTAFLVLLLLAFTTNLSSILDALGDADWSYLPFLLVLAPVGFFGGAMSLLGAVPRPLPYMRTVLVMFGQSFLNRFTPANAGGMALRARYLQLNGSDITVAAASVGLTSLASGVVQVIMLVVFGLWAGSTNALSFSLPSIEKVAIALFILFAIVGAVMASSWGRALMRDRLVPSFAKVAGELREVARRPSKLALLFGGATIAKMSTILAFVISCWAFGFDVGFARLVFMYMTANTVAAAVPTPGGVGAIEAALVAVLTGAGADPAEAVSIVLVFRLVTYWMPILPSWLALRRLRHLGIV